VVVERRRIELPTSALRTRYDLNLTSPCRKYFQQYQSVALPQANRDYRILLIFAALIAAKVQQNFVAVNKR